MDVKSVLDLLIQEDRDLELPALLELILPHKDSEPYKLADIDKKIADYHWAIESRQRNANDKFDAVLSDPIRSRLNTLPDRIDRTSSCAQNLLGDIARTRGHFELIKKSCHNDKVIKERQEMVRLDANLKRNLQRSKFSSILEFFDHFCAHLETSLATCRKLSMSNLANYLQCFDWANYHQVIFFLRACGQAMGDLEKFERLHHFCKDMFGLSFRQPINKMDLNNLIEFHSSYSLSTQVDVILNSQGDRCELGKYIKEPKIVEFLSSELGSDERLFGKHLDKVVAITIGCCQLLVDLNLYYIEAYLTDGINIDRLNGCDTSSQAEVPPVEALPAYAFSPQDYITQLGQHLFALKKQTEKFDQLDDGPLMRALSYLTQVKNCTPGASTRRSATETVLECVARQIIRSLVGRTTSSVLSQLNTNGRKQIATDAMYLNEVLKDLNLIDISDPFVDKFKNLFADPLVR